MYKIIDMKKYKRKNHFEYFRTLSYPYAGLTSNLDVTELVQPVKGLDESNPRISWGKYELKENGRILMPLTVLVHHSIVDGIHISKFYSNLEKKMIELTSGLLK